MDALFLIGVVVANVVTLVIGVAFFIFAAPKLIKFLDYLADRFDWFR